MVLFQEINLCIGLSDSTRDGFLVLLLVRTQLTDPRIFR